MKETTLISLLCIGLLSSCVYDDYMPIDQTGGTDTSADTGSSTSGSDNTGTTGGDTTGTGDTGNASTKVTYYGDAKAILDQMCISCHNATKHEEGVDLSTYATAKNNINKILESIQESGDDIMPPSGKMADNLIQTLKNWKTDGLLEGDPNATGTTPGNTTGNYTYTADIKVVLDQQCNACHGSSNPSAGLNLTTYTLVTANIDKIISRIDLQTGQAGIMPPSGRMAETKIQMFKDWKTQSMPQ